MCAFAQNGTAAAARVPIDNEQSKYFLFQLSFVSQSGGIPLSFLLSFHLYTFMQNISLFCILSCYFVLFRFFVQIAVKLLDIKVHVFCERRKILRNLHLPFACMYCRQK